MLRYEPQSPIVSRSRIVQVVRRVRATRVGAMRIKTMQVTVAPEDVSCGWLERMWRKLTRAA